MLKRSTLKSDMLPGVVVELNPPESKRNFLKLRGVSGTALWS